MTNGLTHFCCTVRSTLGTYQTGTFLGKRASCTTGPEFAARRLAEKVLPGAQFKVREIGDALPVGITMWRIDVVPGTGKKG